MSKYSMLLPLLRELEELEHDHVNYDPQGYHEEWREKEMVRVELKLDDLFREILESLSVQG